MFLGEFAHSIDSKGRIVLPSKFREALGSRFIITKGLDMCLFVYSSEEWEAFHEKVSKLPVTDEGVRRFVRFFFGGAAACEPDAQGRNLIPQNLRDYSGIKKDVVTIGVANRIEIWSKENWDSYNSNTNFVDETLAEKMAQFGI